LPRSPTRWAAALRGRIIHHQDTKERTGAQRQNSPWCLGVLVVSPLSSLL
jgi:hypothetical protein